MALPTPATRLRTHDEAQGGFAAQDLASHHSFDDAWQRAMPTIFSFAVSRVGMQSGEDIVSETYLAAFGSRRSFDKARSQGNPLPWFLGVANNVIRKHRRSEKEWTDHCIAFSDVEGGREGGLDSTELIAERRDLARAMASLPQIQREALLLHALVGLSYAEIAIALNVREGTVRSRINRARASINSYISRKGSRNDER